MRSVPISNLLKGTGNLSIESSVISGLSLLKSKIRPIRIARNRGVSPFAARRALRRRPRRRLRAGVSGAAAPSDTCYLFTVICYLFTNRGVSPFRVELIELFDMGDMIDPVRCDGAPAVEIFHFSFLPSTSYFFLPTSSFFPNGGLSPFFPVEAPTNLPTFQPPNHGISC